MLSFIYYAKSILSLFKTLIVISLNSVLKLSSSSLILSFFKLHLKRKEPKTFQRKIICKQKRTNLYTALEGILQVNICTRYLKPWFQSHTIRVVQLSRAPALEIGFLGSNPHTYTSKLYNLEEENKDSVMTYFWEWFIWIKQENRTQELGLILACIQFSLTFVLYKGLYSMWPAAFSRR